MNWTQPIALRNRLTRDVALKRLTSSWNRDALELELDAGATRVRLGDASPSDSVPRVEIRSDAFFWRLLTRGEVGAGESYVFGEWTSDDLVGVLRNVLRNLGDLAVESPLSRLGRLPLRVRHALRANTRRNSRRNIHDHYDLGNGFYELFLGKSWVYSCAEFNHANDSLDDAQAAKLERIFDLLDLQEADHLLDVGCGWGELAVQAARQRGCRVTGISVSPAQLELATQRVREAGVADRVSLQLCDYRDVTGRFDKIASVEMIEAVGYRYLPEFFARAAHVLKPGGRLVVQSITMPEQRFDAYRRDTDWTQAYVFPGCLIPSMTALEHAMAPSGLNVESVREIGHHYAPTIDNWLSRYTAQADQVAALGFDETFRRTWTMYLSFSQAAFAEQTLGNAQLVIR